MHANKTQVEREELDKKAAAGAKLKALRQAAQIGIGDIAAGRYRTFTDAKSLRRHFDALAVKAIERIRKSRGLDCD